MVHVWRQMQVGLFRTDPVELNGVLMRNKCVFLTVQEKNGTLSFGYLVNVPETLVHNH